MVPPARSDGGFFHVSSKFELAAIALATIGVFVAAQASAQSPAIEPAPLEAQAGRTTTFDIPSQPLAQALTAFGQQAGLQIAVNAAAVSGKTSIAVSGAMTAEQALQRLLAGTGVSYRFTSPNAVTVSGGPDTGSAVQLDPVRVQANAPPPQAEIGNPLPVYAGGNVARGGRVGELGNRDYMDTPFSTTTYTEKYIERNQARTLVDAVNDDPTIRPLYAQGAYDDRMQIRGFLLGTGDMSFNGLYGVTPIFNVDLAGIDRIEVFRGPSAMLSGMAPNGAIGGTINFAPKRATVAPITQLTARYASNGQFGGNIDFGRRFGPDDSAGLRLNAAFMSGNTSVSNQTDTLLNLTAGFDFRGENTRIDADIGYTNRNITGTQGGTFLGAGLQLPPAPNAQNNYYPSWLFKFVTETYGMLRFEHDFTPDITAYAKVGGRRTNGAFALAFPTITNSSGAITAAPNNNLNFNEAVSADTGVRTRFATGALKHEAVRQRPAAQHLDGVGHPAAAGLHLEHLHARPAARAEPLPVAAVAAADVAAGAQEHRHHRCHVGPGGADPVDRRRALAVRPGLELERRHRPADAGLRCQRRDAVGEPDRAAVEGSVVLRQLHPGARAGTDRRSGPRQCRPGLPAVRLHPVRGRHQARPRQLRRHAQRLPDHAAELVHQSDQQQPGRRRPAAQSRHRVHDVRRAPARASGRSAASPSWTRSRPTP